MSTGDQHAQHTSYTLNAGQYCEAGSRLLVERRLTTGRRAPDSRRPEAPIVGDALDPPRPTGPADQRPRRHRVAGLWKGAMPPGPESRPEVSAAGAAAGSFPADSDHRGGAGQRDRPGRDLRAGGLVLPFDDSTKPSSSRTGPDLRAGRGIQTADFDRALGSPNGSRSGRSGSTTGAPATSRSRLADESSPGSAASTDPRDSSEFLEYKSILATWR